MLASFFTHYPKRWILCAVAVMVLAVWGFAGQTKSPAISKQSQVVELTFTIWPQGRGLKAAPRRYRELACDFGKTPAGLDTQGCKAVRPLQARDFQLSSDAEPCKPVEGDPALAEVRGVLREKPITVMLTRATSCQVKRWDRLGALIGSATMINGQ